MPLCTMNLRREQPVEARVSPHGKTASFSLIVPTVGRSGELRRLFDSLRAQTYKNFHVIIVDQSPDDRVKRVIDSAGKGLDIQHLYSERGLSRARNVGLQAANGNIIAFPDDDCWYPPDLLERVLQVLAAHPNVAGVTGKCVNEDGIEIGRFRRRGGYLNRFSVWTGAISVSIFLRKDATESVGGFDENLGVGAPGPYQSGEETDYLLRMLEKGFRVLYRPDIVVYHSHGQWWQKSPGLLRGYGAGMGRVLRKHHYPHWFALYLISRSIGGFLLSTAKLDLAKARARLSVAAGRISGWLAGE
jgi:GT2 family glycosyltransferase